ncbi:hypothetical protein C1646_760947 [Rhizophagus diaphanus]|nr:hypothetical protein C1646_760947 [Rhizophagus diaphanus] [Rhizophagus sp. MUCL 43196]
MPQTDLAEDAYEWFNKIVPKPINNHPGYDIKYVSAYIVNYCYGTDLKKIIGIEWEYDTLSVVKPGQSLVAWADLGMARCGWCRYGYEIKSENLIKYHWDNECFKAKTPDGIWEVVRNNNTLKEKKFLNMPSRGIHCTVNLDIWHQLSDRLAIARNKIQCNYIMSSAPNFEPAYISPAKQEMIPLTSYQLSNCKSNTGKIFISSRYAKQPKGTALRLRDGTPITSDCETLLRQENEELCISKQVLEKKIKELLELQEQYKSHEVVMTRSLEESGEKVVQLSDSVAFFKSIIPDTKKAIASAENPFQYEA